MIDPFEGLEEAPNNSSAKTDSAATNKKETSVANTPDTQSKIVVTLKGGSGYEAPWIVVHADSADDALETLNDERMKALMEQTKKVGSFFGSGGGNSRPAANGRPAGATQPPAGAPTPPEGYVYKTGMGKNGRPWYAFMGENRSDNLPVIWLNADGTRRQ